MAGFDAEPPPHEPGKDHALFTVKAAVSLVPIAGPLVSETLAHVVNTRQAKRAHEFDVAVATALTTLFEQSENQINVEEVVDSDAFVAAVTRAQRAASETASAEKRRRLAAAVSNAGDWAPFSVAEREQFIRLVEEFGALHIWLLHYFVDPAAWLRAHDLYEQHSNIYMGSITNPLQSALGASKSEWFESVSQACADLDREGLASVPLTTMMSASGIFEPRTAQKGSRFLAFIAEPNSAEAEPPM